MAPIRRRPRRCVTSSMKSGRTRSKGCTAYTFEEYRDCYLRRHGTDQADGWADPAPGWARTGGRVWQGRRRWWRWERGTGRGPGGWPACARPRSPPGPGSCRYATPTRRWFPSPKGPGARLTVCACVRRGTPGAPGDGVRSGRPRGADRALVASFACQRPADLGCVAELWMNDLLTAHVRKMVEAAGHPRLAIGLAAPSTTF